MGKKYPIRVLHRGMSYNRGGIETYLMNYYRHLDRDLVQFDFIVPQGTTIAFENEIKNLGGGIYKEIVSIKKNPLQGLTYDRNFFKHHPEISILHINDCSAANLRLMKTAKKYGVQTRILHSHNSNYLKPLKKRQLLVEQWNKKHLGEIATDLFACSNDAGKFMFGNEPFTVVKNAVETEKFLFDAKKRKRCRTVLGVSDEQTVIGCVARFDVQKNHTFLIDIFSEYKKRDNTAILVLVGEGVLRTEVEEKINQLGLTDSVMMLGMRDDVPDLLNAFDIFVLPSLSEGLSLVMIEGQINGLNFVVSDQVPTETNILGKMDFVSLHESASIWAQKIAHMVEKKNRSIDIEVVRRAGYDISIESKKLQEFYLSRVK